MENKEKEKARGEKEKAYREKDKEIYNKAILSLKDKKILRILEIGCANEESVNFLRKAFPNSEIYGTEYVDWKGKFKKYKELKSLTFVNLNKDNLPFEKNFFDLVACNQVLEHIYEVDRALDEINRVLKGTGYFISGMPNLAAMHERISLLFGFNPTTWHTSKIQLGLNYPKPTENRTHCNGFTIRGLKKLLIYHNFKPIKYLTSEVYLSETIYIPFLSKVFKNIALSQCWISKKDI